MKKFQPIIMLALVCALALTAHAEESFNGDLYEAYKPVYSTSFLEGWEVISYIEPSGLLLSATRGDAEITVALQEESTNPNVYLTNYVAGVTRYGKDLSGSNVISLSLGGFEQAARVEYTYRSLRDEGSGDLYHAQMAAAKLKTGTLLTLSMISWGDSAQTGDFIGEFVSSFRLEPVSISTTYTALLKYCEGRSDGIYLTLDYCEMEFDPLLDMSYAVNRDEREYTYKLRSDAEVWLPDFGGALYSLKRSGADETEISIAIESYYNLNEIHAVYMVLFDENGDILRLQHYNAL